MTTEQQNRAWACLPKEVRSEVIEDYKFARKRYYETDSHLKRGVIEALENLFGKHNLASDTEPEEMLFCRRFDVMWRYEESITALNESDKLPPELRGFENGKSTILKILFGDKCLPDK